MSLAPDLVRALEEAAGTAVEAHAPELVDGEPIGATLRPPDGDGLARCLEHCARLRVAVLPRGGGSRLTLGNPPRGRPVFLSTALVAGIDELDLGEGVCLVRAGTQLERVREALAGSAWELPLDPPGASSTVGGALAAAALGPRALGFGKPRDVVLGLEVILAGGERTRCGGRVVKNVTGYDLAKLYVGSLGTLGVIEGAWLRLRARPRAVALLEARVPGVDAALAHGLAAARLPTARAAAVLAPAASEGAGCRLVVELAGEAPAVERDAGRLADAAGAGPADATALDRARELQAARPTGFGVRARVSALPSRLAAAARVLRAGGASLLIHPGLHFAYAAFAVAEGDAAGAETALECVAAAARDGGGAPRVEAAPAFAKRARDVFGEPTGALVPMRALKARFDPDGLLNPGRFWGRL
jgi:glycolate oxidase FAD binding subunit